MNTGDALPARWIEPGGGLNSLPTAGPVVIWHLGGETITLDGDFTAGQLRALADHMDAKNPRKSAGVVYPGTFENVTYQWSLDPSRADRPLRE